MGNDDALQEYHTEVADVFMRPDGILKIVVKPGVHIELKHSKELFEITRSLSKKRKDMLVMSISGDGATYDKEVRDFAMSDECSEPTLAEAVVVTSLAHKLLVNFSLNFYKPKRHIKMFTNESEAIEWLLSFKK